MNSQCIDAYILGFGGLAKEIEMLLRQISAGDAQYLFKGFISANRDEVGKIIGRHVIAACDSQIQELPDKSAIFLGMGNPQKNSLILNTITQFNNIIFPNLIHPTALGDWQYINMKKGNIITAENIFTTDISIGSFNLFNLNCTIGHDATIGDYNVFNPSCSISGNVTIGSRVFVGTGAQILQGLSICDDVIIGAGAVVTKNIAEPGVYAGIPAKRFN